MEIKSTLKITDWNFLEQEFQWFAGDTPVELDDETLLAVRFWRGPAVKMRCSTESGEIKTSDGGLFKLKLTPSQVNDIIDCCTYDIFALVPGAGVTPVIKGKIQVVPESELA